jgi:hypothetical protein
MLPSSERAEERAAVFAAPSLRTLYSDETTDHHVIARRNAQPIPAGKPPPAPSVREQLKGATFISPNRQHL